MIYRLDRYLNHGCLPNKEGPGVKGFKRFGLKSFFSFFFTLLSYSIAVSFTLTGLEVSHVCLEVSHVCSEEYSAFQIIYTGMI